MRVATQPKVDEIAKIRVANCEFVINMTMLTFAAWTSSNYASDDLMNRLDVGFEEGNGIGITVSALNSFSYQKVIN